MTDISHEVRQRNIVAGQIEDAATSQEALAHAFKGMTDVLLAILHEMREMNNQQIMP